MLSVSELLNSFNRNQLVIKISVQIDDFTEFEYPSGSHIHFDDDSVQLTNCKTSTQNYLYHRRNNKNWTRDKTLLGRKTL